MGGYGQRAGTRMAQYSPTQAAARGFFCTQHMRGDAKAFHEMTKLAGKQPIARCAVTVRMDPQ
ncbi:hypothetical protein NK8_71860 (plasmid) [Caballeronia sp. NK8]|nr:hypothetical protein NK8_71860 [Caballeronia sp. NK8]